MKGWVALFTGNRFLYHTSFLFLATAGGSAFGYLYQVFVSRALGPSTFGHFAALYGLLLMVAVLGASLRAAIASGVARSAAKEGEASAIRSWVSLALKSSLLFLGFPLLFLVAARPIASFLGGESPAPVAILGIAIYGMLLLSLALGLLQGLQRFKLFALNGFILPQLLKLLLAILFIQAGGGLGGAVAALVLSEVLSLLVGLASVRGHLLAGGRAKAPADPPLLLALSPSLLVALFFAVPANVDVILVAHLFPALPAGLYAAAAALGKMVILLPSAVSTVMLPQAAEKMVQGLPSRSLALQGLLLTVLISLPVVLVYWLFPERVLTLFLGEPYLEARAILGTYGVAMFLTALNFLLVHYALALQRWRQLLYANLMMVGVVVGMAAWHPSLGAVVWWLLGGNLVILLVNGLPLLTRGAGSEGKG